MLFIDNETVRQVLTIDDTINSLDTAFRGLVDGGSIHRPRIDVYVPTPREDDYYRWGTMEGASRDLGVFAIRMKSDVVSWPEDANGNWASMDYWEGNSTDDSTFSIRSGVIGNPDGQHANFKLRMISNGTSNIYDDFFIDDLIIGCVI